jgi:hypothetical protein
VREIVGVNPALMQRWSTRRALIKDRQGELAARFLRDHGRPPTPVEALQLAQQATLETRDAKHEPRSLAEQRASWHKQAAETLGGPEAVQAMIDRTRSVWFNRQPPKHRYPTTTRQPPSGGASSTSSLYGCQTTQIIDHRLARRPREQPDTDSSHIERRKHHLQQSVRAAEPAPMIARCRHRDLGNTKTCFDTPVTEKG